MVLRHRPADIVVEAERVLHDRRRITRGDRALRLLRRCHPRVDLAGLQVRVRGVVVGELHRVEAQGVHDVVVLHGALHDTDAYRRRQIREPLDRTPVRHHECEVAEVVAVGEADQVAPGVGGSDRRRADVEPVSRHLREQSREVGSDELDL